MEAEKQQKLAEAEALAEQRLQELRAAEDMRARRLKSADRARRRLQLLFKFAGTVTAAFTFWLLRLCTTVSQSVYENNVFYTV